MNGPQRFDEFASGTHARGREEGGGREQESPIDSPRTLLWSKRGHFLWDSSPEADGLHDKGTYLCNPPMAARPSP